VSLGQPNTVVLCPAITSHSEMSEQALADAGISPTTVRVAVGGVEKGVDLDWTLQAATGTVTFALAPALGAVISAGFEFDVPVRFDTDRIQTSIEAFQAGEVPSVPVVELRV
jgi:uncharacterized protein (TIGR02217 family)